RPDDHRARVQARRRRREDHVALGSEARPADDPRDATAVPEPGRDRGPDARDRDPRQRPFLAPLERGRGRALDLVVGILAPVLALLALSVIAVLSAGYL